MSWPPCSKGPAVRDAAETLLRTNLGVCRRALGPDAAVTLEADEPARRLAPQAEASSTSPSHCSGERLAGRRRVLRAGHPDTLHSVRDLCLLCMDRARFSEAEALADEYERGIRCAGAPNIPTTCRPWPTGG